MIFTILRRVAVAALTLLVVYTVVFFLAHAIPGGPWDAKGDRALSPEVVENMRRQYALDRPLAAQYFHYLGGLLKGDMGTSFRNPSQSVTSIITTSFPVSAQIGAAAMALAVFVGIPAGAISAVRHPSRLSAGVDGFATLAISAPPYVVATILLVVFGVSLQWVPVLGWDGLFSASAVVPVTTLAIAPAGAVARYFSENIRSEAVKEYVASAHVRGLSQLAILTRHTGRNALLPVVTVLGVYASLTLVGSFFVEAICGVPGLGRYLVLSISARDYPVVIGLTLFVALVVVVLNMAVDICYQILDPRVRA